MWAVLIMSILGVLAVLVITLVRPDVDNASLIGQVLGYLLPTTMALLAFLKSQETHSEVNSRMTEFVDTVNAKAGAIIDKTWADGVAEGRRMEAEARK